MTLDVDLDMESPPVSDLTVNSPADLAGPWEHRAAAFGQPFYDWDATADLEWVDDGSVRPQEGCQALQGFTPGNIALIDRGNCEFGLKALGAEAVGASAVIIVNNDPAQPLSGILMGAGEFGTEVTVPVLMIHYDDGAILRPRMLTMGETVNGSVQHLPSVGPGEPWVVTNDANNWAMWAFGNNDPDCVLAAGGQCSSSSTEWPVCCAGNNRLSTFINVTPSGQPTPPDAGFTLAPTSPLVGETVTFDNNTTGTPPITYAWDFGDGATSTDENPTHAYTAAGTYTVTLTATNAAGSDDATATVTVNAGAVVPDAGFTWTAAGLTATFTNTTTGTAPITYAWDFGDGGTSTDAAPAHAYAAAGTYTVTLTATNSEGSDTATDDVTVSDDVQLDEFYFVAAAANAAGAAGSFFVTDLEINNAGTTDMMYRFLWLPRDTDNSNPTASDVFTLAAGVSVRYENVLNEVFAASDVVGALAIVADSADAIVMSRTFNQTDDGTFGQAIDGLHSSELIQAGERMRVVFMTENDAYRSNLGVLNGTGAALAVMVARYDAAGEMLGDMVTVELDPWENTQLNRVLQNFAPVAGYVDVWTETAGGAFAAYGSVLDNVTSDPTTVNPK
jgi:PKD repeat protein